jgi:hypothetical protein
LTGEQSESGLAGTKCGAVPGDGRQEGAAPHSSNAGSDSPQGGAEPDVVQGSKGALRPGERSTWLLFREFVAPRRSTTQFPPVLEARTPGSGVWWSPSGARAVKAVEARINRLGSLKVSANSLPRMIIFQAPVEARRTARGGGAPSRLSLRARFISIPACQASRGWGGGARPGAGARAARRGPATCPRAST